MPGALIAINQDRPGPTTSFGTPGVARNDLWMSQTVRPTSALGGNASQEWTLLDVPPGSASIISAADQITCAFDPDMPGSYRLQLTTNGGGPGNVQILICAVRYDVAGLLVARGWRIPALNEVASEDNFLGQTRGWDEALRFILTDVRETLDLGNVGSGPTQETRAVGLRGTGVRTPLESGFPLVGSILSVTTGASPEKIVYDPFTNLGTGPSLWLLRTGSKDLVRIDLATNYTTIVSFDDFALEAQLSDLTVGGGYAWVTEAERSQVLKVTAEPTAVKRFISIPETPNAITFDATNGKVVVGAFASRNLYSIDDVTSDISPAHPVGVLGDVIGDSILSAQGFLWVSVFNAGSNTGKILKVHPTTFVTLATLTPTGAGNGLHLFGLVNDVADGKIFFLDRTNKLWRIDVAGVSIDTSIVVPGTPEGACLGPAGQIWVTIGSGAPRKAQKVTGLGGALALGVTKNFTNTSTPRGIAYSTSGDLLYVCEDTLDQLFIFNPALSLSATQPTPGIGVWIPPDTTGKVLTSQGAGLVPTYVNPSAGSSLYVIVNVGDANVTVAATTPTAYLFHGFSGFNRTALLQAAPTIGLTVLFLDTDGTLGIKRSLTLDGNGKNIDGAATYVWDIDRGPFGAVALTYVDNTIGWKVSSAYFPNAGDNVVILSADSGLTITTHAPRTTYGFHGLLGTRTVVMIPGAIPGQTATFMDLDGSLTLHNFIIDGNGQNVESPDGTSAGTMTMTAANVGAGGSITFRFIPGFGWRIV